MFRKLVFPVDLSHIDHLTKALETAFDLARHYKAEICFIGVTGTAPSAVARSPQDFTAALEDFAAQQTQAEGMNCTARALISHDPTIDTDKTLLAAIEAEGADLVVMQTHAPSVTDYIWAGHGDTIAAHANASVFLVR